MTQSSVMNKYYIQTILGKGAFGEVYSASRMKDNKSVAVKVEKKDITISRLSIEYEIYKKLIERGVRYGIPKIYEMIDAENFNLLVMERLGKNLEELFNENNKKFCIDTVLYLSLYIVSLIEILHKAGFIHRDIKPSNFMVGFNDPSKLYIVDFGLSKEFITKTGNHIPQQFKRSMIGTARYSSINMHLGIEPSRRDDLEAIGYMLIFLFQGKLPWQGIKGTSKKSFFEKIGDTKLSTKYEDLCRDMPKCYIDYLKYCRSLTFAQTPDYTYLKTLFAKEIKQGNHQCKFEWIKN